VIIFLSIFILFNQVEVSGYVETRPYIAWGDSLNFSGYNRGWLEFKYNGPKYGTQIAFDCLVPYDTLSFASLVENINISRLAIWLGPENFRITAGKQRLYWGVGRVFRPLDVFNPTNFFEPGYERPGSNAILGYYSIGNLSSIRTICLPELNFKKSFYGIRFGTNLVRNDIGINFMHRSLNRRTIVGAEITGDIVVGYWTELSYNWEDTINYAKASVGIDYTFPWLIYTMAEFFYDGSGVTNPQNYDNSKILAGERITLAQKYLYLTIGSIPNPFLRPSLNSIINLDDKGLILIPQLQYSIYENTELTMGLNFFLGANDSEFKNISPYDGQVYVWAKVYF